MKYAVYERIKEKWLFGDVTKEEIDYLCSVIRHFHPSFDFPKQIAAFNANSTRRWEWYLDDCFTELAAQMGDNVSIPDRLLSIKKVTQAMFDALLHTITDDEVNYICKMDYGHKIDKHSRELRKLIFEQDGIFAENQTICPHEVIILSRHFVAVNHEREFIFANMIMVHNMMWGRYVDDSIDDYYAENKALELSKVDSVLLGKYIKYVFTADRFFSALEQNPRYFTKYTSY